MEDRQDLDLLKKSYRRRYYRNRLQDLPDLQPGDDPLSTVSDYFHVPGGYASPNTSTFSSSVGNDKSNTEIQQREQRVEQVSSPNLKNSTFDDPQHIKGETPVLRNNLSGNLQTSKNLLESSPVPNKSYEKLFSDDSDESQHTLTTLIEDLKDGASDSGRQSDKSPVKSREQMYSSESSVVQEHPCPTANLLTRNWQETCEFQIEEEETSFNLGGWVSPAKATRTPLLRPEGDKSISSIGPKVTLDFQRQKSEIIQESVIDHPLIIGFSPIASDPFDSSAVVKNVEEEFEIKDLSDFNQRVIRLRPVNSRAKKNLNLIKGAELSVHRQKVPCISSDVCLKECSLKNPEECVQNDIQSDEEPSNNTYSPSGEMTTVMNLKKKVLLEGRKAKQGSSEKQTGHKTNLQLKNVALPLAESGVAQSLFEEHSPKEDSLNNTMIEHQQSNQQSQTSRKSVVVEQIVLSGFETNEASLSKSRAVVEDVDEDFEIEDVSNFKQIFPPHPRKSKSVKNLCSTDSGEMSVDKQNVQNISNENDFLNEDFSKKIQPKIIQKHIKSHDFLVDRKNKQGTSQIQKELKRKALLKKDALPQAKNSMDEEPLIGEHLPQMESILNNKSPGHKQSKQKKSASTSKSKGRAEKIIVTDDVEMPTLETNISADNNHNAVDENGRALRRTKRLSVPPGPYWIASQADCTFPTEQGGCSASTVISKGKKQTKENNTEDNNKNISKHSPKSEMKDQKKKEKQEKFMQTSKTNKGIKKQKIKANENSKSLDSAQVKKISKPNMSSKPKKQVMSKRRSAGKGDLPIECGSTPDKGLDNNLQSDSNFSQTSTVQGVCHIKQNMSLKRKHVDEEDEHVSPKRKVKYVRKNKSKELADFEDCRQLDTESIDVGTNAEESRKSQPQTTDLHLHSQQENTTGSSCFSKLDVYHNPKDSIFQSGPVLRRRLVQFTSPVEPLACPLNSPELGDENNTRERQRKKTNHCESAELGDDEYTIERQRKKTKKTNHSELAELGDENNTRERQRKKTNHCESAELGDDEYTIERQRKKTKKTNHSELAELGDENNTRERQRKKTNHCESAELGDDEYTIERQRKKTKKTNHSELAGDENNTRERQRKKTNHCESAELGDDEYTIERQRKKTKKTNHSELAELGDENNTRERQRKKTNHCESAELGDDEYTIERQRKKTKKTNHSELAELGDENNTRERQRKKTNHCESAELGDDEYTIERQRKKTKKTNHSELAELGDENNTRERQRKKTNHCESAELGDDEYTIERQRKKTKKTNHSELAELGDENNTRERQRKKTNHCESAGDDEYTIERQRKKTKKTNHSELAELGDENNTRERQRKKTNHCESAGDDEYTIERQRKKTKKTNHSELAELGDENNTRERQRKKTNHCESAELGDDEYTIERQRKKTKKTNHSELADPYDQAILDGLGVVSDPDTKSDSLADCIRYGEKGVFSGNESFQMWRSFNNSVFSSGKLKIGPLMKNAGSVSLFKIISYYIDSGLVKLTLHRSHHTLKSGDFFYIPPGNSYTLTNLQKKEAILVFTIINYCAWQKTSEIHNIIN
ncbi:centromere protein C isoform X8 [Mixophyes fleayi]|uniref:centromere protein C isoform X8 n=1 Tax=Mixophyes fleayi TaxID=3061075 RepID=UPI003F4E22EF